MKKSILASFLLMGLLLFASCSGTHGSKQTAITDTDSTGKEQSAPIHLTRAEFLKKVVDYETSAKEFKYLGDKPAIIDFYADWCGPCKKMAPTLDELSKEYAGKIYIYKVDVDSEQDLAAAFGIQSLPTIWFVPMKGEPQMSVGAMSKEQLKDYIDKVLLK